MNAMLQIVAVATAELSDAELISISQAVQTRRDPRDTTGYAKIHDLFTDCDGLCMHPATRQALAAITLYRLTRP